MDNKYKRIITNLILIPVFACLSAIILVFFAAEMQFEQAKKLERDYRWEKAEKGYQSAGRLNPMKAEYFAAGGNLLIRQSRYHQDTGLWLKRAERLYKRASFLNPRQAEYWYWLGMLEIENSSVRAGGMDNFKKAIALDPYNSRINYLTGHSLLGIWEFLDSREQNFTLDRLSYVLELYPWDGRFVYPAVVKQTKDLSLLEKITAPTLAGRKALDFFKNNYEIPDL